MRLHRLFLDANVFFAAVKSQKGGSRLILDLAQHGKMKIVTVRHALREAERNIEDKLGEKYLLEYYRIIKESRVSVQAVDKLSEGAILELKKVIVEKDIPIIVGAFQSGCEFLITLDRKHLLDNESLRNFPFKVLTPGEFIQTYL
ncbi:MAG: hypothetical protein G01um101430_630 [Parcubacteria group bacterium Gr01-1014_30]|nr:MAG: hypothetical protein G01um101430_630 [Parcubacteria group bacterium Gr01-1014_30]